MENNIKTTSSLLPTKQKVYLFILLAAYFGISIFSTIKVFVKFLDLDDDISDFCGRIKGEILSKDYEECHSISTDFEAWGCIQGIVVIILFVINLMISVMTFISFSCGTKCAFECCTICRTSPQCFECLQWGIKWAECITNAAVNNPVVIQFFISIFCCAATSALLSASKRGDSLCSQLIQKYNLIGKGGCDLEGIITPLIIVIVFFALILASTPIYWILSKCYFNKIDLPDTKVNAGNKAEINIQNESSQDIANKEPNIMETNSEIKPNNFEFKGETNSNIKNEVNSNINEANN